MGQTRLRDFFICQLFLGEPLALSLELVFFLLLGAFLFIRFSVLLVFQALVFSLEFSDSFVLFLGLFWSRVDWRF